MGYVLAYITGQLGGGGVNWCTVSPITVHITVAMAIGWGDRCAKNISNFLQKFSIVTLLSWLRIINSLFDLGPWFEAGHAQRSSPLALCGCLIE